MRLVCVISSLSSGGAERVMSELANTCASRGWSVRLVTVASTSDDFYCLTPDIDRVALDSSGASGSILVALVRNWQRIRRLRGAVTSFNPDAVLVFGARTNILALLALKGTGIPVVVSERTDPFALNIGFPWQNLRPWAYRSAAKIVAQTQRVAKKMDTAWCLRNIEAIPNPLARELPTIDKVNGKRSNVLLSVGRLSREKGHDILLDAWASVRVEFSDWRLRLVGNGPERGRLEAQAASLGLGKCLEFAGQSRPVWPEYLSARAFVLPSRREGFPNALLEALACGCVCIASNCKSGPAEIFKNGERGQLYEPNTADRLAEAIRVALRQSSDGVNLSVLEDVRNQYAADAIADQWINMLMEVTRK
jgi:glycosyltransferase involved in cell wall biosynthesis